MNIMKAQKCRFNIELTCLSADDFYDCLGWGCPPLFTPLHGGRLILATTAQEKRPMLMLLLVLSLKCSSQISSSICGGSGLLRTIMKTIVILTAHRICYFREMTIRRMQSEREIPSPTLFFPIAIKAELLSLCLPCTSYILWHRDAPIRFEKVIKLSICKATRAKLQQNAGSNTHSNFRQEKKLISY